MLLIFKTLQFRSAVFLFAVGEEIDLFILGIRFLTAVMIGLKSSASVAQSFLYCQNGADSQFNSKLFSHVAASADQENRHLHDMYRILKNVLKKTECSICYFFFKKVSSCVNKCYRNLSVGSG